MCRPVGFLGFVWVALFGLLGCRREPLGVVCHITYGGEVKRVAFAATANPYTVKALDVAGRFAFKVIYVREPWQAASIGVYAYQRTSGGDRLLQEGKYARPFSPGGEARYGFTGRQLLYSTDQRELEYWCEIPR